MQLGPKFITVDEFDNYWTANLREMLRTSANESNQAEMFLARVERRLMAYIDNNTFRRYKYEELVGFQLDAFKEAIILQAMYVYKNGDLGMESGYNAESGFVAKRSELIEIALCQDAIDILSNAGLWNMVMKNRPRKFGGVLFGDYYSGGTGWPAPSPTPTPTPDPTPTPTPDPTVEYFTITLLGTNGIWNKSTLTVEENSECDFDFDTLTLTIGSQTATFTPNNGYQCTSFTSTEKIITANGIVRAIASIVPDPAPTGDSLVTLFGINGTWNVNSIRVNAGTTFSFDESTLTLTIGSQTAIFTPKENTVFEGISTSTSGVVSGDMSITGIAQKIEYYTVTLSAQNGSWDVDTIDNVLVGTTFSFDESTLTLTVGEETAVFTPDLGYAYASITNSNGEISSNITITATAIQVFYTITLSAQNGSWDKQSITGVESGTTYSFNRLSGTLTVGSGANVKTAAFTPTYNDEFDNYTFESISSASGVINGNITITATAEFNPDIEIWSGNDVFLDNVENTTVSIDFNHTNTVKIWFDILGCSSPPSSASDIDDEIDGQTLVFSNRSSIYTYNYTTFEWQYGYLLIDLDIVASTVSFTLNNSGDGSQGEKTIVQVYEIRGIE